MEKARLWDVGPAEALAHPTWRMGPKITIDSATMMNKGLEVIEAHHLFGVPYREVRVVVHRQSVVHGGVDRKSTRLNSSHANISYAVFCLKKKIIKQTNHKM